MSYCTDAVEIRHFQDQIRDLSNALDALKFELALKNKEIDGLLLQLSEFHDAAKDDESLTEIPSKVASIDIDTSWFDNVDDTSSPGGDEHLNPGSSGESDADHPQANGRPSSETDLELIAVVFEPGPEGINWRESGDPEYTLAIGGFSNLPNHELGQAARFNTQQDLAGSSRRLKRGMTLVSINGHDTYSKSPKAVKSMLRMARRPMTLEFQDTALATLLRRLEDMQRKYVTMCVKSGVSEQALRTEVDMATRHRETLERKMAILARHYVQERDRRVALDAEVQTARLTIEQLRQENKAFQLHITHLGSRGMGRTNGRNTRLGGYTSLLGGDQAVERKVKQLQQEVEALTMRVKDAEEQEDYMATRFADTDRRLQASQSEAAHLAERVRQLEEQERTLLEALTAADDSNRQTSGLDPQQLQQRGRVGAEESFRKLWDQYLRERQRRREIDADSKRQASELLSERKLTAQLRERLTLLATQFEKIKFDVVQQHKRQSKRRESQQSGRFAPPSSEDMKSGLVRKAWKGVSDVITLASNGDQWTEYGKSFLKQMQRPEEAVEECKKTVTCAIKRRFSKKCREQERRRKEARRLAEEQGMIPEEQFSNADGESTGDESDSSLEYRSFAPQADTPAPAVDDDGLGLKSTLDSSDDEQQVISQQNSPPRTSRAGSGSAASAAPPASPGSRSQERTAATDPALAKRAQQCLEAEDFLDAVMPLSYYASESARTKGTKFKNMRLYISSGVVTIYDSVTSIRASAELQLTNLTRAERFATSKHPDCVKLDFGSGNHVTMSFSDDRMSVDTLAVMQAVAAKVTSSRATSQPIAGVASDDSDLSD